MISSLKSIIRRAKRSNRQEDQDNLVVKALHLAIMRCRNVRELFLHQESEFGHDDAPSPIFLRNMWAVTGLNLRKVRIISPSERLPLLLDLDLTMPVKNLEELIITFVLVRSFEFLMWSPNPIAISRPFIAFAQSQRHSLQSLAITSSDRLDLTSYFAELGFFPCLRKLRILVVIDQLSLPMPSTLTRFMDAHKTTLQGIEICPRVEEIDSTYTTWISGEFAALELPALQALKIASWAPRFPKVPRLTLFFLTIPRQDDIPTMIKALRQSSGDRKITQIVHVTPIELRLELAPPGDQAPQHEIARFFADDLNALVSLSQNIGYGLVLTTKTSEL